MSRGEPHPFSLPQVIGVCVCCCLGTTLQPATGRGVDTWGRTRNLSVMPAFLLWFSACLSAYLPACPPCLPACLPCRACLSFYLSACLPAQWVVQEPSSPVPVLTPSDSPAPAPDVPPPLHPDAEQQQQQDLEQDAGLLAASLAGLAGPDMGFATAVAAAAAAAAAAERQASGSSSGGGGGVGSGSNGGGALPPGYATLQAHAILHCLADLQVNMAYQGAGVLEFLVRGWGFGVGGGGLKAHSVVEG